MALKRVLDENQLAISDNMKKALLKAKIKDYPIISILNKKYT